MTDLKKVSKLRRIGVATLGLALLCTAGPSQSQGLEGAAAIAARKNAYGEIGAAFKSVNDELRKPKPLPIVVKRAASTIHKTAVRIPNLFPAGTGPGAGVKTAAKPEIWTRRAEFDAIQRKFLADAAKMDQLAAGTDMKAVAAQARVVGASCKACHDKFRTPEN